jgi:hypothetical protein
VAGSLSPRRYSDRRVVVVEDRFGSALLALLDNSKGAHQTDSSMNGCPRMFESVRVSLRHLLLEFLVFGADL